MTVLTPQGTSGVGAAFVGISGFRYAPFRGVFYPKGLKAKDELRYASERFSTIEINGSFYSLQRPQYYESWWTETPPGFVFAVKGGRYITHMRRLRDVEPALSNFFASGVLCLREKLGPFLWQFPASLPFDRERFETFLALLPKDTDAAARLARGHDAWLADRVAFGDGVTRPVRHAVEIRNATFLVPEFIKLLRRHGVALVVADTARTFPLVEDVTADFVYVRLHGDEELYASGYSDRALFDWAGRIHAWRRGSEPGDARRVSPASPPHVGRDVYVYFDNDIKVHAPFDALFLARLLETKELRGRRRHSEMLPESP